MTRPCDKSRWGDGPWQHEPDEVEWSFGDVACRVTRNPNSGTWLGYIAVPPSHPWHEKSYNDFHPDVHGGLTFAGRFEDGTFATATNDQWWIGFDCHHAFDFAPGYDIFWPRFDGEVYRNLAYVKSEVEGLAKQAIESFAAPRSEVDA